MIKKVTYIPYGPSSTPEEVLFNDSHIIKDYPSFGQFIKLSYYKNNSLNAEVPYYFVGDTITEDNAILEAFWLEKPIDLPPDTEDKTYTRYISNILHGTFSPISKNQNTPRYPKTPWISSILFLEYSQWVGGEPPPPGEEGEDNRYQTGTEWQGLSPQQVPIFVGGIDSTAIPVKTINRNLLSYDNLIPASLGHIMSHDDFLLNGIDYMNLSVNMDPGFVPEGPDLEEIDYGNSFIEIFYTFKNRILDKEDLMIPYYGGQYIPLGALNDFYLTPLSYQEIPASEAIKYKIYSTPIKGKNLLHWCASEDISKTYYSLNPYHFIFYPVLRGEPRDLYFNGTTHYIYDRGYTFEPVYKNWDNYITYNFNNKTINQNFIAFTKVYNHNYPLPNELPYSDNYEFIEWKLQQKKILTIYIYNENKELIKTLIIDADSYAFTNNDLDRAYKDSNTQSIYDINSLIYNYGQTCYFYPFTPEEHYLGNVYEILDEAPNPFSQSIIVFNPNNGLELFASQENIYGYENYAVTLPILSNKKNKFFYGWEYEFINEINIPQIEIHQGNKLFTPYYKDNDTILKMGDDILLNAIWKTQEDLNNEKISLISYSQDIPTPRILTEKTYEILDYLPDDTIWIDKTTNAIYRKNDIIYEKSKLYDLYPIKEEEIQEEKHLLFMEYPDGTIYIDFQRYHPSRKQFYYQFPVNGPQKWYEKSSGEEYDLNNTVYGQFFFEDKKDKYFQCNQSNSQTKILVKYINPYSENDVPYTYPIEEYKVTNYIPFDYGEEYFLGCWHGPSQEIYYPNDQIYTYNISDLGFEHFELTACFSPDFAMIPYYNKIAILDYADDSIPQKTDFTYDEFSQQYTLELPIANSKNEDILYWKDNISETTYPPGIIVTAGIDFELLNDSISAWTAIYKENETPDKEEYEPPYIPPLNLPELEEENINLPSFNPGDMYNYDGPANQLNYELVAQWRRKLPKNLTVNFEIEETNFNNSFTIINPTYDSLKISLPTPNLDYYQVIWWETEDSQKYAHKPGTVITLDNDEYTNRNKGLGSIFEFDENDNSTITFKGHLAKKFTFNLNGGKTLQNGNLSNTILPILFELTSPPVNLKAGCGYTSSELTQLNTELKEKTHLPQFVLTKSDSQYIYSFNKWENEYSSIDNGGQVSNFPRGTILNASWIVQPELETFVKLQGEWFAVSNIKVKDTSGNWIPFTKMEIM